MECLVLSILCLAFCSAGVAAQEPTAEPAAAARRFADLFFAGD